MKKFIMSHKKLCIALLVIFILILGCFVWFHRHIGVDNLPLHKISGTVEFTRTIDDSDGKTTLIWIKLDDPFSWPENEYMSTYYNAGNFKERDKVNMICGSIMRPFQVLCKLKKPI